MLEASRRSWSVHSRLSLVSHGHLIHRVLSVSELKVPAPSHYPLHAMESQRVVFRGDAYLGYLSKHGFFVPEGADWESTCLRDMQFMANCIISELALLVASATLGIVMVRNHRQRGSSQ